MSRMQLEEVSDEYDLQNDDNYTDDSGSDSEEDTELDSDDLLDETLYERITALKDIIPPPRRAQISYAYNKSKNAVSTAAGYGGKTLWAVTSSLLLLGIPFMIAIESEAQVQEEEKAVRMQGQANELLAPGTSSPVFQQPQQSQAGVRPPGF